jgi:hypothetical protein
VYFLALVLCTHPATAASQRFVMACQSSAVSRIPVVFMVGSPGWFGT